MSGNQLATGATVAPPADDVNLDDPAAAGEDIADGDHTPGTDDSIPGSAGGDNEPKTIEQMEKESMAALLDQEGQKRNAFTLDDDDSPEDGKPKKGKKPAKDSGSDTDRTPEQPAGEQGQDKSLEDQLRVEKERRVAAQRQFHAHREEIAELKKRIAELESDSSSGEGDSGQAVASILDGLSDDAKEIINETPGMKELVDRLANAPKKSELAAAKKVLQQTESRQQETERDLAQQWEAGIRRQHPKFEEIFSSIDFVDWKESHPQTVRAILKDYDQYDPEGALKVIDAFNRTKAPTRRAQAKRNQDLASSAQPGRRNSHVSPAVQDHGDKPKTIEELERESMAALLQEERQKRRSF